MPTRKRNKEIILRLSNEEYDFIQDQFAKSSVKNRAEFFLTVLRKKQIIVNTDLTEMLVELKQHGNYLNQISKRLDGNLQLDVLAESTLHECYAAYKKLIDLKLR